MKTRTISKSIKMIRRLTPVTKPSLITRYALVGFEIQNLRM